MKKEIKQKKKQLRRTFLPTSVRFSERWQQWKSDLREFVLTHFLLLFKLAVALLFVLMALLIMYGKLKPSSPTAGTKSNPTGLLSYFTAPQLVKDLRAMESISALTVERDLVVSQFKLLEKNPQPVSIHVQYSGLLEVGVDLDKKEGEWLQIEEDTVFLNLPPIEILTPRKEIIKEANKQVLIETGTWTSKELNDLYERASYIMNRLSIVEDSCLFHAEKNARMKLLNMIRSHGYKHGVVNFAKNEDWKPILASYKPGIIPNDYNYYTAANGEKMIFYKNGSIIHYGDNIPFEHLYNLAEFSATAYIIRPAEITVELDKNGYTLLLCNTNANIKSEETKNYINFIKTNKEMREELKKMMNIFSKRLFDNQPCKIIETDINGDIILDYSKL